MAKGRTRQLSIQPGMSADMLRLISEQRQINKEFDRRKPLTSPTMFFSVSNRPDATQNGGRIIIVRNADGSLTVQYSDGLNWQSILATSISFATPAITYATTAAAGSASTTIRSDARLKFPSALMSTANSATLTLTDNATDQTLTGSLGDLNIVTASFRLSLPYWNGAGGAAPTTGSVLAFTANTGITGSALRSGVDARLTIQDASTYTSQTFQAIRGDVTVGLVASQTFTTCTVQAGSFKVPNVGYSAGTHSFTEKTGLDVAISPGTQSGAGTVAVTDCHGLRISGWPTIGTGGVTTNARSIRILMPTVGSTIRRGVSLETGTQNLGTEATNVEGYYCEDITRGTAQRTNFYAEGATNSTPTDVYAFFQGTAHVVGTNRYGARFTGATTGTPTLAIGVQVDAHAVGTTKWAFYGDGDASHFAGIDMKDATNIVLATGTGTKIGTATTQKLGFWNAAPVARPAAYTPTNVTTDRSYDANATTVDELADVLGTLIGDLQSIGLIG